MTTVSIITTTGSRPEAFALCEKYIARQTWKGNIQHIVVCDNWRNPTQCTLGDIQEFYRSPLEWKPGINSQRYSLALGISKVKGDYVFIWEDDDAYKPQYLEVMLDQLKYAPIVGECGVTYYSLLTKGFMEMGNNRHASLCQTAFKKGYIHMFEKAVHSGEIYIDIALWGKVHSNKQPHILFSGQNLCVGMKGVGKGRAGIGVGHRGNEFTFDTGYTKLKQLLGEEDAKPYIKMMEGK